MTYTGNLDAPPIVIVQSRRKVALMLCLSVVFVAACISIGLKAAARGESVSPMSWIGALFFGLGVPLFGYQLVKPARLLLEPQGFTYKGPGKAWTVAWRDVEGFGLMNPGGSGANTMVCWTYRPHYDRQKTGRAIASAMSGGAEGALPGLWSVKAKALVALMEAARLRWTA